jgi:cytochrome c peroxidase
MTGAWLPTLPLTSRSRHESHWVRVIFLCLSLLLGGVADAQGPPPSDPLQAIPAADQEPIAPLPPPPAADPRKLALGERLFSDSRLSAAGNLSCSTCHDIRSNGARANDGHVSRPFDTLTVFNAALNFRLNWEGNYRTLSAHIESSLENPVNMNTNADEVVGKLSADPETVRLFRAAYGRAPDRESFFDALMTFEKSLVTPGARFDRWLGGDASALSAGELEGYRLFKSLGCIACHQGANVGGNLFERQGVFHPLVQAPPETVRVPSLRNVATTAPYFHDGSAATLQEAVRKMAAAQLDRSLTDEQMARLVDFLGTLTGNYRGSPVTRAKP